ncbi:ATP-binding protein [Mumia zhuanghuii]|uniref:ATP-binding protein n=2 Tax=Mumia TaxID=1546255 RepID=A0ABW1QR77_9ACTN|nr:MULTISPECIES: ATP-binding protein [Mumia]KAA1423723.1 ATP-binding protein [Mumia zhuanghuii]
MTRTARALFDRARRRSLVGRDRELATLRAFLDDDGRMLAYLHGPGGVGKSALLDAIAGEAAASGRPVVTVDCANLEPGPGGLQQWLQADAGASTPADGAASRFAAESVLVIDRFELLEPAAGWFWRAFVPSLPVDAHVVVAGRRPPPESWRLDPAFAACGLVVPVRNLDADAAAALVRARGVTDDETVAALVRGSRGHPLALVIATDEHDAGAATGGVSPLLDDPDVTARLLGRFLDDGVTALQREALHVCGHARRVDRSMLRQVLHLEDEDADTLLSWVRERPYAESHPDGLTLHEVVRDALDRDLRWRDREAFVALHGRIRDVVLDRMSRPSGADRDRLAADLLHLHRGNPQAQDLYAFEDLGALVARPSTPADAAWIVDAFAAEARTDVAAYWVREQPEAWTVFEDAGGRRTGVCLTARLDLAAADAPDHDPVAAWALKALAARRPPEPGEVVIHQVGLDTDVPGRIGPVSDQVAAHSLWAWRIGGLGWVVVSSMQEEAWAPIWTYIGFERLGCCRVGGADVGVWARDFARSPYVAWLAGLGARELDDTGTAPASVVAPVALARADFHDAVRQLLKDLHDPPRLRRNPLVGSRLAGAGTTEANEAVTVLAERAEQAVSMLAEAPRMELAARAVDRTYLRPGGSQEKVAGMLGLPFSTYRRHLSTGIDRVEELLWDWELHGPPVLPHSAERREQEMGSNSSGE